VIGAAPGSVTNIDWHDVWNNSKERRAVKATLADMKEKLCQKEIEEDPTALDQFAAPFGIQLWTVLERVFEQYWRTPSYLYSKTVLCTAVVRTSPSFIYSRSLIYLGSLHRLLILEISHISARNAESTLLRLHASDSVRKSCATNHAPLRYSASTI
jgi:hypothetical protein